MHTKTYYKSVVALVILIIACFACVAIFNVGSRFSILQFVGDNSESAQKLANSIVDYTLPGGYLEQGSLNLGIFKMVFITPGGQQPLLHARNVILLTAFPSDLDIPEDKVRLELRIAMLRSSSELSTMEFVREESATIHGEAVTLEVYESFGAYDPPTRMVFSSLFPGKSDKVMLMVAGPIASWDQSLINQFIESIR